MCGGEIYTIEIYYDNEAYYPDMGVPFGIENRVEFWVYVDETGIKPINNDTFNDLMNDPTFKDIIDSIPTRRDCYELLQPWLGVMLTPPSEETMRSALENAISSFPILTATKISDATDDKCATYEVSLKYSQRENEASLKVLTVNSDGTALANMPFNLSDMNGSHSGSGKSDDKGQVFAFDTNMPVGIYILSVNGVVEKEDESYEKTYIRTNAAETPDFPATSYGLVVYVGPRETQLITANNVDELNKDPQFQTILSQTEIGYLGGVAMLKQFLIEDSIIVNENGTIKLSFTPWNKTPQVNFKAVDSDNGNAPLDKVQWNIDNNRTVTGADGEITATFLEPGMHRVTASRIYYDSYHSAEYDYKYMASHEMFRYAGENKLGHGNYHLALWVTLDGDVKFVDDTELKNLCKDQNFLDLMSRADGNFFSDFLYGTKPNYSTIKQRLYIPGDYTLDHDANDIYLLPFTKTYNYELTKEKDETVFGVNVGDSFPITVTYECPASGTYRLGWENTSHYDEEYIDLTVKKGNTIVKKTNKDAMTMTVDLVGGTAYTFVLSKTAYYSHVNPYAYFRVFVERIPDGDLHTADYIKVDGGYTNMVSLSCGTDMEHMILARYPGNLDEGKGSWVFNVAVPKGTDFKENDSIKVYCLPNDEVNFTTGTNSKEGYFGKIRDKFNNGNLSISGRTPLNIPVSAPVKAESFSGKDIYSLSMKDVTGVKPGDLLVITYTNTVNTAAWYGSIADSNMSYGYWSIQKDNKIINKYDTIVPVEADSAPRTEPLADPAICGVFGVKIYKYSNYDRMLAASRGGFDNEVLMQEHLLSGAEFKLEGDNLPGKFVVISDKLVAEDEAAQPAMLSAGEPADEKPSAGAALAQRIDDDTAMKLLYYRYEQGIKPLNEVSVKQTQTYYALNDDNLYTNVAPEDDTLQFYADNGQGYRLKPVMYSAREGETIQAGDGGGLLLGGLGAGEYTLTEVKAPEGYAVAESMTISIEWVRFIGDYHEDYVELGEGEVPVRNGEYGLICKINGQATPTMLMESNIWYPHGSSNDYEFPDYSAIWNPRCFVAVNPIGDDRISFVATKEVNDPADSDKTFELKFTIKDPKGKICTNVKYAICNEDGEYVTQEQVIARADGWTHQFKPGEKIAFLNLLEGSTYEVAEENGDTSEYIVSYENETGTIDYNGDFPTAAVLNKKGEVVISKTVTGAGDKNKEYTFLLELKDRDGKPLTDITCVKGETETKVNSGGTITLKHGESATLYLPNGASYKVTEKEADKDGYTTTVANSEGTITGAEPISVEFTNHKEGTAPKPTDPAQSKPGAPANPSSPASPDTGDSADTTVWFAAMAFSAAGMAVLCLARRKKTRM